MNARHHLLKSLFGLSLGGCTLFAGLTEDRQLAGEPGAGTAGVGVDSRGSHGGSASGNDSGGDTAAPGGAGAGGEGGALAGGAGPGGADSGGAGPGEGGEGGGPAAECEEGEGRCVDGSFQGCTPQGKWGTPRACVFVCSETEGCTGDCAPDTRQCGAEPGDPTQLCDEDGTWLDDVECEFGCEASTGECLLCEPKSKDCEGLQPVVCLDDGLQWSNNGAACTGECINGACPTCKAGDPARCNGNVVETCVGGFYTANKTCAGGTAACTNGACTVCQGGATRCTGATPQTCNAAGSAWVNGAVTKGKCGAACTPNEELCTGAVSQICSATGQLGTGSVIADHCGAVCNPGAPGCTVTLPKSCGATGQWVNGTITPGTCGAQCTPGTSGSCSAKLGAVGTCAGGNVTCQSNGMWGACSIGPSTDSCDPGNDNSCNGVPTEPCPCINGQTQSCGACNNGIQVCAGGNYGGCSVPDSRQVYYHDADGDNYCNAGDATLACSQPGGYLAPGCAPDCHDGNGGANTYCGDFNIDGPSYGKGCCGGAEDRDFDFDCGAGWRAVACEAIRQNGGSNGFWISGFDEGFQAGKCWVHYSLQGLEGVTGFGRVWCRPWGF